MAKVAIDLAAQTGFDDRDRRMARGVAQLIFSYLPGKIVDWEDGVAIVQLRNVRLARVWSQQDSRLVLEEVAGHLATWKERGGLVHPNFPDPRAPNPRVTVGEPVSISATPLDGALICRVCSQLVFRTSAQLGSAVGRGIDCPTCNKRTLRQFGQVFVHGCGQLETISEYLPWMKVDAHGAFRESRLPLRCQTCGPRGVLTIPARTERARDMSVVCRACNNQVQKRLVARCPACVKQYVGKKRGEKDEDEDNEPTAVARVVMRLANSRANDAYYAHTVSLLRLDRPRIAIRDDEEIRTLTSLLPKDQRPQFGPSPLISTLEELTKRLAEALTRGDAEEHQRLSQEIAAAATNWNLPQDTQEKDALVALAPDVAKGLSEALAFRTTVTARDADEVLSRGEGATTLLAEEIRTRRDALGLKRIALVDDLPVIAAAFGYSRRSFEPTYSEEALNAFNLPTTIRPFYALDQRAARWIDRLDAVGTVPILAKEGEHEGIFVSFDPARVAAWLAKNGVAIASGPEPVIPRILSNLEEVDRYYDRIWDLPLRRMVFGLVHSLSHSAMRIISRLAGLERTSLSEYIFLPLLATVVYANGSTTKLGGMETVIRDRLLEFLEALAEEAVTCLYDPDCLDRKGACHGCLHSPEISCRAFNHGLSRAFLSGGHCPWVDPSKDQDLAGYWE